jgi:hypothetical protein
MADKLYAKSYKKKKKNKIQNGMNSLNITML